MMQLSNFEFWMVTVIITAGMSFMSFAGIRFVKSVDGLREAVSELKIVVSSTTKGQEAISNDMKDVKVVVRELVIKSTDNHEAIVQNKEQIKTLFAQTGSNEAEINALRHRVGSTELSINTIKNMHKVNHNQDIYE